jgi:DNA-binding XRE family transcriptional regulator
VSINHYDTTETPALTHGTGVAFRRNTGEETMEIKVGIRIKCARLRAQITQQQLAKQVGCSRNHISSIETGKCQPSLDLWLKLQRVLKL